MSYKSCEDCGCRVYGGFCTNCHEEVFIAEQYYEDGLPLPDEETEFMQKLRSHKPIDQ